MLTVMVVWQSSMASYIDTLRVLIVMVVLTQSINGLIHTYSESANSYLWGAMHVLWISAPSALNLNLWFLYSEAIYRNVPCILCLLWFKSGYIHNIHTYIHTHTNAITAAACCWGFSPIHMVSKCLMNFTNFASGNCGKLLVGLLASPPIGLIMLCFSLPVSCNLIVAMYERLANTETGG